MMKKDISGPWKDDSFQFSSENQKRLTEDLPTGHPVQVLLQPHLQLQLPTTLINVR